MEVKRQRKRIDYARMSKKGLEAAVKRENDSLLPCSSCGRNIFTMFAFSMHIAFCTKVPHKCPVCPDPGRQTPRLTSPVKGDSGDAEFDSNVKEEKEEIQDEDEKSSREVKKTEEKPDVDALNVKSETILFASAEELDQHMVAAHNDIFAFNCWVCDSRFKALLALQKHQLKEHRIFVKTTYTAPSEDVRCTACSQQFNSANELADHFEENEECGGGVRLAHCMDLDPDVEDDLQFRLRDCKDIERQFMTRFPYARCGLSLMLRPEGLSPSEPSAPRRPARAPVEESSPRKRGARKGLGLAKRGPGRPRIHAKGPMQLRIEAAMKRRRLALSSLKQRQTAGDASVEAAGSNEATEPSEEGLDSDPDPEWNSALKANGSAKGKFFKRGFKAKGEIAMAAATVNSRGGRGRGRGRGGGPRKRMRVSTVADDQVAIITSPKRRRLSPNTSGLVDSDDDNFEGSTSPYTPLRGRSVGLEPEGASEEDDDLVMPSVALESCDLDEDDDDERAAPAVELNVCRACGVGLDSFNDYTRHMQHVHGLILQSPPPPASSVRSAPASAKATASAPSGRKPGRPPGRPRSTTPKAATGVIPPDKENGPPASSLQSPTYDRCFPDEGQLRQQMAWANSSPEVVEIKPKGRGRGRKPKVKASPGDTEIELSSKSSVVPSWTSSVNSGLLCPLCPDRPAFSSSESREAHLASLHDGERAFGCQSCGETFSLFYELQLHTRQEHDVGSETPAMVEDPARAKLAYKCVVCKVGFHVESVLQRHYDAMHTLDEGEQYHCPVCYFTYSGCRTRDDHVIKKHPDARAFKCPVCEARFASFEVFRAHEKRAHISQKTRVRGGAMGVEGGPSLLGLEKPKKQPRRKLAAAMRGALGEKNNEPGTTPEELAQKRRESRVYKEGTLLCEKCGEDCANEEELDIHTKEHVRKEKRFGCTQCGRVFSGTLARSFLVDHIKLEHMHQSPYACDDCGQRFLYKVQADRHRTVDRDSGVASCRRAEDLPLPLPRLVFGCSRCAKIFAGEGAQSRYSEHQLECIGTPPAPGPSVRHTTIAATVEPRPPPVREPQIELKEAEPVPQASPPTPPDVMDQDEEDPDVHQTVLVLPGSNEEAANVQEATVETESGEQVVVLSEDVLSDVRAAAAGQGNDVGGGSVVLIQADDGTLIVASEEQLAELQMAGAETETAQLVAEGDDEAVALEEATGRTVRQLLHEKRLRETSMLEQHPGPDHESG